MLFYLVIGSTKAFFRHWIYQYPLFCIQSSYVNFVHVEGKMQILWVFHFVPQRGFRLQSTNRKIQPYINSFWHDILSFHWVYSFISYYATCAKSTLKVALKVESKSTKATSNRVVLVSSQEQFMFKMINCFAELYELFGLELIVLISNISMLFNWLY